MTIPTPLMIDPWRLRSASLDPAIYLSFVNRRREYDPNFGDEKHLLQNTREARGLARAFSTLAHVASAGQPATATRRSRPRAAAGARSLQPLIM